MSLTYTYKGHTVEIVQNYALSWDFIDNDTFDASYEGEDEGGSIWRTSGIHGTLGRTPTVLDAIKEIREAVDEWEDA